MKLITRGRAGAALAVTAGVMAIGALTASPAAASPVFDGGGLGPTAQNAVLSAFWDAQTTAQSVGFYGACTMVGEPQIFETFNDPHRGHVFRAQVRAVCQS
jgi:hypothetical protein